MALSERKYKKFECITFKNTKGKFGGLSNMAPGYPIMINDTIIRTVESFYQALRFPDYPDIQKIIIEFSSPISAKKYGRNHIDKTRKDWGENRFKLMKFCIELKLDLNRENFTKILNLTKNLPIVEYTDKDKVWGATDEGEYYVGTNALGRLLMELRDKNRNKTITVEIPQIDNLKFLNKKITIDSIKPVPENKINRLGQLWNK
ncbi:MAG: DUF1768 domain-containing protein [Bacteroidales bacterium]|nr:DUF1768 domain-containing protein [Bacteroidales bacterium]